MKHLWLAFLCLFPALLAGQVVQPNTTPEGYLVVAPSAFREALRPLLMNRLQEGYAVEQLWVDSADAEAIHRSLQTRYDEATPRHPFARYILLVGDVEQIAPFPGRHKPSSIPAWHYTDLYYGEFTGDGIPECFVGRLPARDTSEVRVMVENILRYERLQTADSRYLQRALLVAGKENSHPAPTATNGTVNYFKQRLIDGFAEVDTACFYNPASNTLLETIVGRMREGNGIVYYTGHGNTAGWVHPTLDTDRLDTLALPAPALYINNACQTQHLMGDNLGKHLMRRQGCGAIGVIGASNEALWNEDYYWAVGARTSFALQPAYLPGQEGAIDRLIQVGDPREHVTLGTLLHSGGQAVGQAGSPYETFYWELYNLFGDPALMPYIGIPAPMTISAPDSMTCWATEMTLGTLPFARVAVSCDTLLLGVATADSSGYCRVPLALPDRQVGRYTVKATLGNHIPTTREVVVTQPQEARLALVGQALLYPTPLSDGDTLTLRLTLRNMGRDTAFGHSLTLTTADGTLHTAIAALPAGASCEALFAVTFRFDTAADWQALLTLADDTGVYASVAIYHDIPHATPAITAYQILEGDMPARRLVHNRPYRLQVAVSNPLRNACRLQLFEETFALEPLQMDTLLVDFTTPDTPQHHLVLTPVMTLMATEPVVLPSASSWWIIGEAKEGFEGGCFNAFPWDTSGSLAQWRYDGDIRQHGGYSVRSGHINSRQTSRLRLALETNGDDTVRFWVKTSCEGNYDRLNFYIDEVKKNYWSGDGGWRQVAFPVSQGRHQLTWEYSKDDSGNSGRDCAWIDGVELPLGRWEGPYGYFSGDSVAIRQATARPPSGLSLSPNPTHDRVLITLPDGEAGTLLVYSRQGALADRITVPPATKNIPHQIQYSTAHLRSGMYLVVFVGKTTTGSEKLIVIH